LELE
jgi:hypothetical protein